MKNKIFLLAFLTGLLMVVNSTFAAPVTPKYLMNKAVAAFQQVLPAGSPEECSLPKDYHFVVKQHDTLLLIVNFPKGFIVMAADDAVMPMLAYSTDQQYDYENPAPAANMWIEYYASQVQYARNQQITPSEEVRHQWDALDYAYGTKDQDTVIVHPLITALWNQTRYYNAYSPIEPEAPGGYDMRTPNGCVAVAMAMIMYYYRYPHSGQGSHTNHTDYGDFYVNFSQQNYFYEAMSDKLDFYNNEVAKLIFHCGTAVDMMYGADGSGAYSQDVPWALTHYFGYSTNCEYLERSSYSLSQWKNILKENLDASRPLYYSGCSDEGCHAFVCDGYDNRDYFHFNFGWGGSSNGFYILKAVPADSNAVGGYSHSQRVVRNIYPGSPDYPYYCANNIIKCASGTLEDGSNSLDYLNNANCTYVITEDSAYSVHVQLLAFETQQGHDSLSFWDGHPNQGRLLKSFSGSMPSENSFNCQTDSLYITFVTDDSVTAPGWRLKYSVSRHEASCQSNVIRKYRGVLTDGSGDMKYRSNANCVWRLSLPHASWVSVSFTELDIAEGDYLFIYDRSVFPKELLATIQGSELPDDMIFYSNNIAFEFRSDNYLNGDGFELRWDSDYSPAGIEEAEDDTFTIFPNPASTEIHVHFPGSSAQVTASIYDITGRLLIQQSLDHHNSNMDIRSLPAGFYTVTLSDERKVMTKRLIIQH